MSMALSALGYGKNAAGTVVKTASVAPDKTGDLLIFLGTKLKGLAAGMSVCGENLKFSGAIDLMVSRGKITGDEVAAVAAAKGINPEAALKIIALQRISGTIEKNSQNKNSVDNNQSIVGTVKDNDIAVPAAVVGPTVISVRPEKKDIQDKDDNTAANDKVQGEVSVAASEKNNTVAGAATDTGTPEEIPAHVLALELC